ncbi:MAG: DUF427 domain-containing protein [Actinobacteria bacterium]|nr:DUF427 domain-containing protein [Actinomycetota bacterium]
MTTAHTITIEPAGGRVRVAFAGETLADTTRALVLREAGLPPVFYFPPGEVRADLLTPTELHTRCPFKGEASYWTVTVGDRRADCVVWGYPDPLAGVDDIREHLAFFSDRVEIIHEP